ncbi:hypothetical protein FNJ87_13945 [Nonlabens mediterrranea]|uniref:histidine kinase n=1 Tax=Nonlabens mediterrranea TaxID=1419947 RepID=A0ABS0A7M1_9FLAO|nr:hypothetical protein [Nonlabens mediterrranea]
MIQLFTLNNRSITRFVYTIIILLTTTQLVDAQVKPLDSVMNLLNRNEIPQLREIVKNNDVKLLDDNDKALYVLATGGIKYAVDDFENAYKDLQQAKSLSSNKRVIFMANDYMMELSNSTSELHVAPESLMEENLAIATELNDPALLIKSKFYFMFKDIQMGNFKNAQDICYEMRKISIENNLRQELIDTEFNLGTLHYYQSRNDSALFYYEKNLADVVAKKDTFDIAVRLNNLAMLQMAIGENQAAVDNLIKAKVLIEDKNDKELSVGLLRNIADAQTAAGNYEEAINYYNQFISEEDSLERTTIAQNLKELQTKYETAEKDLENAELISKNLTSENRIYLLLFILACIIGLGTFILNRMRQKQRLLAAQAEVQKQREEKLLRDQELAGIDAMITGQEKERKKIAQDLHDDIGSSLTTARMCIENVIGKSDQVENKKILENAYDLLNDTYTKVRNISHAQKSSVLSSHGLIGTLEQLAGRINAGKSIQVEVVHHGLQGNLSNSMELGLFRIIQELLNNTIKHAQAQHASIILTGYEDHVSIMVEDDGKGFVQGNSSHTGTGLDSIHTRVQNLDGTMEIDTKLERGTTINIEIPFV